MLILASASPQRTVILEQFGIAHTVNPSAIEELTGGDDPETLALLNAAAKARTVAATVDFEANPDAVVLGADTVVAVGEQSLGKPTDRAEAKQFLQQLSGIEHTVFGGVCLIYGDPSDPATPERSGVAATSVRFHDLSEAQIDDYLKSGEWQGRAGGYAIQETGETLIEVIAGDYLNVVGLPVELLAELAPELLAA